MKFKPEEISCILEELMERLGVRYEKDLAKKLGIAPNTITNRKTSGELPYKEIVKLCYDRDWSLDEIFHLSNQKSGTIKILNNDRSKNDANHKLYPYYTLDSISKLGDKDTSDDGALVLPRLKNEPEDDNIIAVKMPDKSMEINLKEGSVLLINKGEDRIIDGKIYLIKILGEVYARRLFKIIDDNDSIKVKSDNVMFSDQTIARDNIEIIGILHKMIMIENIE